MSIGAMRSVRLPIWRDRLVHLDGYWFDSILLRAASGVQCGSWCASGSCCGGWCTRWGVKGGHNSHEKQLLLMESKAGAEVLSGEGNDQSCVSSVPLARGVRVSGQPRGRPRRRRASALRPELRRPRMPVLCPSQSPVVSFCLWRWGCFLSSIHVVEVL